MGTPKVLVVLEVSGIRAEAPRKAICSCLVCIFASSSQNRQQTECYEGLVFLHRCCMLRFLPAGNGLREQAAGSVGAVVSV